MVLLHIHFFYYILRLLNFKIHFGSIHLRYFTKRLILVSIFLINLYFLLHFHLTILMFSDTIDLIIFRAIENLCNEHFKIKLFKSFNDYFQLFSFGVKYMSQI